MKLPGQFGNTGPFKCNRKDCKNFAEFYPLLRVFAKGYANAPALPILLSSPTCEDHTKDLSAEQFVTDATWEALCKVISAAGKALPCRKKTQLSWWKIDDVQAGKLP